MNWGLSEFDGLRTIEGTGRLMTDGLLAEEVWEM